MSDNMFSKAMEVGMERAKALIAARESMLKLEVGSFVMCVRADSNNVLDTGKVYIVLEGARHKEPDDMYVLLDVNGDGSGYSFTSSAFTGELGTVHIANIDHMDDEEIFMLRLSV